MTEKWLKEVSSDSPFDVYCPYDPETGKVSIGLTYIGVPEGEIVGTFELTENGIKIMLNHSLRKTEES